MTVWVIVAVTWIVALVLILRATVQRRVEHEAGRRVSNAGQVYFTYVLARDPEAKARAMQVAERQTARRGNRLV